MAIAQYLWPDDVLLSDAAITNFQAGSVSDVVRVRIYNDRDNPSGSYRRNGWVSVSTEDPGAAGSGLRDNIAPQDQQWPSIRFVDKSTNNSLYTTDWLFAGAYRIVPFPDLQPDSWREFEIRFAPPSYAAAGNYKFYTHVHIDENSEGMPGPTIDVDRGIITGYGDYRSSYLFEGSAVTASGTPDEFINISAGRMVCKGRYLGFISEQIELNQNDGATPTPVALAVGESYYAIVSRDLTTLASAANVTITKGLLGTTPSVPSLPSGHLYLKTVLVEYTGATSVIGSEDLSGNTEYGRFNLEVISGLDIRIHQGILIAGGSFRPHSTFFDITLSASVTSYIWQLQDGKYSIVEDDDSVVSDSAELLYIVVTDTTDVTSISDLRSYAGRMVVFEISGNLPGSPGAVSELSFVGYERLELERIVVQISDNGGGSSGQTKFDVHINGTTVYTSNATEDLRPVFAFNASTLLDDGTNLHELGQARRGDTISLLSVEHPTGGTPVSAKCWLICRY